MNATETLKAEYAEKLAKAEREDTIRALLPDVGHEWGIYCHGLYGSKASVKLDQPWQYGAPPLTLEAILKAAESLPGIPMVKVKGTFTSYLAVDQLPDYDSRNSVDDEEPIAPWIVEGAGGPGTKHGSECTLEWRARLDGIGIVEVEAKLPFMMALRYAARRIEKMGGIRWEGEDLEVNKAALYTIFGTDGATPVAEMGPRTKWASGGSEYPSRITQAWTALDDRPAFVPTVADFVRALIQTQTK